jgi:hypothetical protein
MPELELFLRKAVYLFLVYIAVPIILLAVVVLIWVVKHELNPEHRKSSEPKGE